MAPSPGVQITLTGLVGTAGRTLPAGSPELAADLASESGGGQGGAVQSSETGSLCAAKSRWGAEGWAAGRTPAVYCKACLALGPPAPSGHGGGVAVFR